MTDFQRLSAPFRVDRSTPQQIVLFSDDNLDWVATCSPKYADLLAAAPELYQALDAAYKWIGGLVPGSREGADALYKQMTAALDRAADTQKVET